MGTRSVPFACLDLTGGCEVTEGGSTRVPTVSRTGSRSGPGRISRVEWPRAMSQGRETYPRERRPGDWFAHIGVCQDELESTTSAALRHVLNSTAAQGIKHRLPLEYKARDPRAGNKNFPFSSHDNKHSICNAAEYFDLGMGLKKLDPERQQGNSTNFFEWAHESIPSSEDGLTIYQTSFVIDEDTQNTESSFFRRYPKHHTKNWCIDKPVPENEKNLQPNTSPEV